MNAEKIRIRLPAILQLLVVVAGGGFSLIVMFGAPAVAVHYGWRLGLPVDLMTYSQALYAGVVPAALAVILGLGVVFLTEDLKRRPDGAEARKYTVDELMTRPWVFFGNIAAGPFHLLTIFASVLSAAAIVWCAICLLLWSLISLAGAFFPIDIVNRTIFSLSFGCLITLFAVFLIRVGIRRAMAKNDTPRSEQEPDLSSEKENSDMPRTFLDNPFLTILVGQILPYTIIVLLGLLSSRYLLFMYESSYSNVLSYQVILLCVLMFAIVQLLISVPLIPLLTGELLRKTHLPLLIAAVALFYVVCLSIYSAWLYPRTPRWLGGASPVAATLYLDIAKTPRAIVTDLAEKGAIQEGASLQIETIDTLNFDPKRVVFLAEGRYGRRIYVFPIESVTAMSRKLEW